MNLENNNPLLEPENLGQEETDDSKLIQNEIIVPDDAFSAEDNAFSAVTKDIEYLPQSLYDEDNVFFEEEDGLLSQEQLDNTREEEAEQSNMGLLFETGADQHISSPLITPKIELKDEASQSAVSPRPGFANSLFDVIEMFVFALAFVLISMAFFCRHSVVDGSSMENTLYEGEHLIISDFLYSPKQGDIVVVQDLSKADIHPTLAKPIVKRVIATEGQTVLIRNNGEVYVDGTLLAEKYVYIDDPDYTYQEISVTVDEGCVFLMGDHRNVSLDSRSEAGFFREEAILGKVIFRFLPLTRFGTIE